MEDAEVRAEVRVNGAPSGHPSHNRRLLYPVTIGYYFMPSAQSCMGYHGYLSVTPRVH
jgi:hypothetical protein